MDMKRKLVKQGVRALTITLPSDWIRNNNLKPGDEIDLSDQDNILRISTEKIPALRDITVDVSGLLPRLADRFMARAYQKGYDKIKIKFDNQDLMIAVQNKVSELMGYEILKVAPDFLEIQIVSTNLDIDFDTMLRRSLLLLMDMSNICHDAWLNGDKKALENIWYQDYDANKFLYFCLRSMNKRPKMTTFGKSILYYLVESLEDLGDELKKLGKILIGIEPNKGALNILAKMNEMFRLSYEFFYKPEKKKAVKAFLLSNEIKKLIDNALKTNNKEEIKALMAIDFSRKIIYHLTTMRLDTLKDLGGGLVAPSNLNLKGI
jgi:phosphate uptake regulator